MKDKRWCFGMLGLVAAVLLFIAGMNYFVDPFGYFAFCSGDYSKVDFKIDDDKYNRLMKAEHVLKFGDQYDAYIVGGSKTGSYRAEKLSELDGYRYYNMFILGGTMGEYKANVEYLLKNTSAKKIILSISGGEVYRQDFHKDAAIYQLPAVMTGESQLAEYVDYLLKDVSISLKQLADEIKNGKNTNYYNYTTGERDLASYYARREADPDGFTQRGVVHGEEEFNRLMTNLFTKNKKSAYIQECLDSVREMKEMCEAAGVEFAVICAPAFIGEMSLHDSTYYWDFLRDLATITDYWDFSGYHDIDLNPYNFYNRGHFYYEIGDLMVDTMNGKEGYEGFGAYVTKYNVTEHLAEREEAYYRLQKEYQKTGTIALQGREDASWIHTEE